MAVAWAIDAISTLPNISFTFFNHSSSRWASFYNIHHQYMTVKASIKRGERGRNSWSWRELRKGMVKREIYEKGRYSAFVHCMDEIPDKFMPSSYTLSRIPMKFTCTFSWSSYDLLRNSRYKLVRIRETELYQESNQKRYFRTDREVHEEVVLCRERTKSSMSFLLLSSLSQTARQYLMKSK